MGGKASANLALIGCGLGPQEMRRVGVSMEKFGTIILGILE